MNEYKHLWEKFKADVIRHAAQGDSIITVSNWLMKETSKYCHKLDDLENKLETPNLPWDERENTNKEICEIIKIMGELARRMEIEQKRLLSGMKENETLWEEYDRIEEMRQLDNSETPDRI